MNVFNVTAAAGRSTGSQHGGGLVSETLYNVNNSFKPAFDQCVSTHEMKSRFSAENIIAFCDGEALKKTIERISNPNKEGVLRSFLRGLGYDDFVKLLTNSSNKTLPDSDLIKQIKTAVLQGDFYQDKVSEYSAVVKKIAPGASESTDPKAIYNSVIGLQQWHRAIYKITPLISAELSKVLNDFRNFRPLDVSASAANNTGKFAKALQFKEHHAAAYFSERFLKDISKQIAIENRLPVSGFVKNEEMHDFHNFIKCRPTEEQFRFAYPDVTLVMPDDKFTRELRHDNSRFFVREMTSDGLRIRDGEFA